MSQFNPQTLPEQQFAKITSIPHGSENEQQLANYVVSIAKQKGYKYILDKNYNVIVYIPATKGYENVDAIILEAHMDMVTIKTTDSTFDFAKDSLQLYVDQDNNLHATGTTLGADDGYGCAYMLAIMQENNISHPAIECVFTVQEETNCIGAINLDKSLLKGKYMIGLDCNSEYAPYVASFTSYRFEIEKTIEYQQINNANSYTINIEKLDGRVLHGVCNNDAGNAIKIIARLMQLLDTPYQIVSINGGILENHIPTDASVTFITNKEIDINIFKEEFNNIKDEYLSDNYHGYINITADKYSGNVLSQKDSIDLINLLYLLPNNMFASGLEDNKLVSLNNIGLIKLDKNKIYILGSTRSRLSSINKQLMNHISILADNYNYNISFTNRYASWPYNKNSKLKQIANKVLQQECGKDFSEDVCPGGLEIGYFVSEMEGLDAIELGCNHQYLHTPDEYMNLDSFNRAYKRLLNILENIKD